MAGCSAIGLKSLPWRISSEAKDVQAPVREGFAKLLGLEGDGEKVKGSDCVSLAPCCGYAMTVAMRQIQRAAKFKQGDKVVLLDGQMSSSVYCWQQFCRETGCDILSVLRRAGGGGWVRR